MTVNASPTPAVYNDLSGLANLRFQANGDNKAAALKEAAKQFEAIFLNMMLKQMREASFGDPLFDSDAGDSYQSMFDQQLALNLSESGSLGIAKLIESQLGGAKLSDSANDANPFSALRFVVPAENNKAYTYEPSTNNKAYTYEPSTNNKAYTYQPSATTVTSLISETATKSLNEITSTALSAFPQSDVTDNKPLVFTSVNDFVEKIWPYAEKAAQQLGISTETLVSQAALETGWGKFVINHADGKSSYNLFGIKADSRWDGELVSVQTTEYRDGVVEKHRANFRAYDSLQQGFDDYVKFLKTSPRYTEALNSQGDAVSYLHNLQQGGYATDPAYANKIIGIMQGETLLSAKAKLDS